MSRYFRRTSPYCWPHWLIHGIGRSLSSDQGRSSTNFRRQHPIASSELPALEISRFLDGTLPRAGGQLQTILESGAVPAGAAPQPPDAAQVADAIARYQAYQALREFRARPYGCLAARPDALFELADAILCADHAVTSLVQLSLAAEFTRGHGALYDALRSEEHTSELQSHLNLVCRLLLEKKKNENNKSPLKQRSR